jgi:hypothetical protein
LQLPVSGLLSAVRSRTRRPAVAEGYGGQAVLVLEGVFLQAVLNDPDATRAVIHPEVRAALY